MIFNISLDFATLSFSQMSDWSRAHAIGGASFAISESMPMDDAGDTFIAGQCYSSRLLIDGTILSGDTLQRQFI